MLQKVRCYSFFYKKNIYFKNIILSISQLVFTSNMWEFYLTPNSIPLLAKFLLSAIITTYILVFIPKNKTVFWFSGYLIGYTLLDFFAFLGQILHSELETLSLPLQYLSSFVMAFSFVQFSYLFKENFFPREHIYSRNLFAGVGIGCFLYVLYVLASTGFGDYSHIQIFAIYPLLCLLCAVVIFFRKYRTSIHTNSPNKNGYLSFFILSALAIAVSFSVVFEALGVISSTMNMIIFFVLNLIIITLLTANFINYLAEETTVLVKLIGLSLVLFITVIGLQGILVIPNFHEPDPSLDLAQSLHLLKEIHNQVEPFAWFLVASVFIIIAIFPFFYNKSVLQPLKTLLNGVDQVNRGNLSINIPVINQDEIGVVTNHFNNMTSNLQKASIELKEYAEELEDRVQKRTKELKSQTELLEIQTKELERMDNFRSKLFMDISHELRTPITLISGPIQKLLSTQELNEETERQLTMSLRNSKRLKKLVEQIIDLNRLESNQLELQASPLDITEKLQYFAHSFESLLSYNDIELKLTIPEHPIELFLDLDKFEKIITNLISNATKFTSGKGLISISLIEEENKVIIKFSDTGNGITAEKLPFIFDRYQTSALDNIEYKEGLGVGLAITKEYMHLHGGDISVESELGIGTTFTLVFQKGKAHLKSSQVHPEIVSDLANTVRDTTEYLPQKSTLTSKNINSSTKAHILIVEDNYDMANYITGILEIDGFTTSHAENGKEGLEKLTSFNPDLIISDIMMPVMNGMEFLEELRKLDKFKNIPTIFLSARSDLEGKLESFRLGVNDYLVKPFDTEELLCRIENLLEFSSVRKSAVIELSDEDGVSIDQEFINRLTSFVEERISNTDFNVEELAAEVSMSRSTLYREIKKATGFSAAAFVKEIRLQKALQKLENKQVKNLNELSYEIGFSTPSYFSKMYLKRFGKKPSDYLN